MLVFFGGFMIKNIFLSTILSLISIQCVSMQRVPQQYGSRYIGQYLRNAWNKLYTPRLPESLSAGEKMRLLSLMTEEKQAHAQLSKIFAGLKAGALRQRN